MSVLHKILATGLGAGYAPIAPGTIGTIVGLALLYAMHMALPGHLSDMRSFSIAILVVSVVFFFLGAWSCRNLEPLWGPDPLRIVIDEIVGMWLSLAFVPFEWKYVVIAFVLFRFFDILKPLGIRKFEDLPNGWGVMADDVVAGIYANLALQILIYFGI